MRRVASSGGALIDAGQQSRDNERRDRNVQQDRQRAGRQRQDEADQQDGLFPGQEAVPPRAAVEPGQGNAKDGEVVVGQERRGQQAGENQGGPKRRTAGHPPHAAKASDAGGGAEQLGAPSEIERRVPETNGGESAL